MGECPSRAISADISWYTCTAALLRVCAEATIGPGANRAESEELAPYDKPRRMRISSFNRAE